MGRGCNYKQIIHCHFLPSVGRLSYLQTHKQKTDSIIKSSHYAKANIMGIVCKLPLQGKSTQTSKLRTLSMMLHAPSPPPKEKDQ